ncbi:hypothetical protein AS156_05025 [Bradyrhizobium macuxiense]|uniref:DUF3617 family protein n=1 Tax=Bradyrhizobium macuxiense TaxID=1755647 RepID=A0A109JVQ4_9BRAD|nr:hypothetical protein AS156_05025 [Bradyrhizobium macuxiense]
MLLTMMAVAGPSAWAHAQTPSARPQSGQQAIAQPSQNDQSFSGPSFRKGLWHFVRTLDVVQSPDRSAKHRIMDREMTRCVDPTQAMKATFSSEAVGTCVSDKPKKVGNKYTFGHRCDYMGAVSTVITVRSDEAYTELNEVTAGEHPKSDFVVATRIGDCDDGAAENPGKSATSHSHH